jgi:hypothetical protein
MKFFLLLFVLFTGLNSNAQTKRALIIAIENYPETSGWKTLNTLGDAVLIQNTLLKQDFLPENIKILTDNQATLKGINEAFEKLITSTGTGDKVVIHFSSHGAQIEDDNVDEEVDGLDESIVPFDAVYSSDINLFSKVAPGYFRDDEFGNKVTRLRNKIGSAGDVLVIIDACHSGTATRGGDRPQIRGSMPAMVSANFNKKKEGIKDTAGVFKDGNIMLDDNAASYVVISAAQAKENNKEIFADDGTSVVGSLSYAVSKVLSTLNEKITYRNLFARIEDILLEKVPAQKPALEGDGIDRQLFGGAYKTQQTYLTGTVDKKNKKIVQLDGGIVTGITRGSLINFYPPGTENADGKIPVATGTVTAAKYFTSTVTLSKLNPAIGNKLYAFITQMAYGTKKIKLGLDSVNKNDAAKLKAGLLNYPLAEFKPPYDLYFGKSLLPGNVWALRNSATGDLFQDSISVEDTGKIKKTLKRFDRYRFLRNLKFDMPGLSVKMMLVLVDENGYNDTVKTKQRTKLGVLELQKGDLVRPLIINTGKDSFYVNIVDMQPNGIINPIIPNKKLKDLNKKPDPIKWSDCVVKPGDTLRVTARQGFAIRINPPYGEETFKVFISRNPLDLEEILTTNGSSDMNSRGTDGQLNNLVQIFKDSEVNDSGTRGEPTVNMDKDGTIKNLNFRIVPKQ